MATNNQGKNNVLVIFDTNLPKKEISWWRSFNLVIALEKHELLIKSLGGKYLRLENLVDPGNIHRAAEIADNLSRLNLFDGSLLTKMSMYKGYELWWVHFGDLMNKFCIPYTRYYRLLEHVNDFDKIYLYKPPAWDLFRHFFKSRECECVAIKSGKKYISIGILIQGFLSLLFLPWAKLKNPQIMVWTSDQFDPPRDHDFRMRFIYEELRRQGLRFVEFIRSIESTPVLLNHALKRKRPVMYSSGICDLAYLVSKYFNAVIEKKFRYHYASLPKAGDDKFWFLVATHYIRNTRGTVWSIKTLTFILKFLSIRAAIIPDATSRNMHEVIACKVAEIKTVGIQHGISMRHSLVYEFMPSFQGEQKLSVDLYGVWSEWWREYYLRNSKAHSSESLCVSGLMRPLDKNMHEVNSILPTRDRNVHVLFVSEQLATPEEVLPYLKCLMDSKDTSLFIKFRANGDLFEKWLINNHPNILKNIDASKILRGSMHDAIKQCDVVVGSYSTGVLESFLQLKTPVFFNTLKWGDYFEARSFGSKGDFFAENPQELVECVRKSTSINKDLLKQLRGRFFGDPYKNGSKWVVEQIEKFL